MRVCLEKDKKEKRKTKREKRKIEKEKKREKRKRKKRKSEKREERREGKRKTRFVIAWKGDRDMIENIIKTFQIACECLSCFQIDPLQTEGMSIECMYVQIERKPKTFRCMRVFLVPSCKVTQMSVCMYKSKKNPKPLQCMHVFLFPTIQLSSPFQNNVNESDPKSTTQKPKKERADQIHSIYTVESRQSKSIPTYLLSSRFFEYEEDIRSVRREKIV